ncbi:oxidoreductase [Apiospora phragmitis]|uniref:Oxidoreductase n=1 Tax=Apiospora phragmitis TaxID=2905665 RepID=A0ABR1TW86_9PEZI
MSGIKFDKSTIPDLSGRVLLITGGTSGIGAELTVELAQKNPARLLFTGRNAAAAAKTLERVRQTAPTAEAVVTFVPCDLASLASVRAAAAWTSRGPVADGYEVHFATNHLGHALLTQKLLPLLERTAALPPLPRGRRRRVGWKGGSLDFSGGLRTTQESALLGRWVRYCNSKLANMLYARELAKRHPTLLCFSIHPGVVSTGLVTDLKTSDRLFIQMTNVGKIITTEQGAFNHLWAVSAPHDSIEQGGFYEPVGVLSSEKGLRPEMRNMPASFGTTEKELERFM